MRAHALPRRSSSSSGLRSRRHSHHGTVERRARRRRRAAIAVVPPPPPRRPTSSCRIGAFSHCLLSVSAALVPLVCAVFVDVCMMGAACSRLVESGQRHRPLLARASLDCLDEPTASTAVMPVPGIDVQGEGCMLFDVVCRLCQPVPGRVALMSVCQTRVFTVCVSPGTCGTQPHCCIWLESDRNALGRLLPPRPPRAVSASTARPSLGPWPSRRTSGCHPLPTEWTLSRCMLSSDVLASPAHCL